MKIVNVPQHFKSMLISYDKLNLDFSRVRKDIKHSGCTFVTGEEMFAAMNSDYSASHWNLLADGWNNLGLVLYMSDGGSYRRRKFAAFRNSLGKISRKRHQPHFQSRYYNRLNGGVER